VAAIGEDGKAMALLTYVCVGESWEITLGYTAPDHRRKDIHTFLFMPLSTEPQGSGISFRLTPVRTNNLAAQAAFEAQGRTKAYITCTYPVKDRRRQRAHG